MPTDDNRSKMMKLAYAYADEHKGTVYVIWKPRPAIQQELHMPYFVIANQADEWEKENGEAVTPREYT